MLHGSLFDIKCTNQHCTYVELDNYIDPIVPALAIPKHVPAPAPLGTSETGQRATASLNDAMAAVKEASYDLDISDDRVPIAELGPGDLPTCPQCGELLRPGVVWFGEVLPEQTLRDIQDFIQASPRIDLILVIGTGGQVYPAAGYVELARRKGAKVAVVNMEADDLPGTGSERKQVDWYFQGDASLLVPQMLEDEIGSQDTYMPE